MQTYFSWDVGGWFSQTRPNERQITVSPKIKMTFVRFQHLNMQPITRPVSLIPGKRTDERALPCAKERADSVCNLIVDRRLPTYVPRPPFSSRCSALISLYVSFRDLSVDLHYSGRMWEPEDCNVAYLGSGPPCSLQLVLVPRRVYT